MKRLAPLLLLLAAAAPAPAAQPTLTMVMAMPAPRPAMPPAAPVFQPAPMPDRDAVAPVQVNGKGEAQLDPTTFGTSSKGFGGDGFTSGSTAQSEQEHRMKPSGGFRLTMPLQ